MVYCVYSEYNSLFGADQLFRELFNVSPPLVGHVKIKYEANRDGRQGGDATEKHANTQREARGSATSRLLADAVLARNDDRGGHAAEEAVLEDAAQALELGRRLGGEGGGDGRVHIPCARALSRRRGARRGARAWGESEGWWGPAAFGASAIGVSKKTSTM